MIFFKNRPIDFYITSSRVIRQIKWIKSSKNGVLRNSSINWIFLWRIPIRKHPKSFITEKRGDKAKYLTWNISSRTTPRCLSLRKDKIDLKSTWFIDLILNMSNLVESTGTIIALEHGCTSIYQNWRKTQQLSSSLMKMSSQKI